MTQPANFNPATVAPTKSHFGFAVRSGSVAVAFLLLAAFGVRPATAACGKQFVDVGGYRLWVQVAGQGEPTVVFESGGGDDSAVWSKIEPEIRRQANVRTLVYDRAGLGKSDFNPAPYQIDAESAALQRVLQQCKIRGPLILIAHSYGGFVSTLVASEDKQVKGMVLVDANLASFFDEKEIAILLARYSPQESGLQQARPDLARVLIPILHAYPATAERVRKVNLSKTLPIIDITAEHTWVDSPEEVAAIRQAHASFVAASPQRTAVFAAGSSHYVMRDRPEIVTDAILRMVEQVRAKK